MANKQLTAKVKLNITDVESKLGRLNKLFNNLDKATNKVGNNNALNRQLDQANNKTNSVISKVKAWANAQKQVTANTNSTKSALSSIGSKLKGIAAAYIGIQGAQKVTSASDTITKAENKINAMNDGDVEATQLALDKMYASAQKVRMGYSDMVSNAAKSMTLAGEAFQGDIDNAIRFQEIMAEAYTLGGASAPEMHTSMYQMIQALGAGILAGDELRSVREGAPLAYKAIEDFVQGVYNTEESLKDLASQGKVTSDMVVAAIMNSGEAMDKQFAESAATFEQTWDRIKNTAIKAFEPVLQKISKILNAIVDSDAIDMLANVFLVLADVVLWVFDIIGSFFNWCAKNWSWLQYIVMAGLIVLAAYVTYLTVVAVAKALVRIAFWIAEHAAIISIILVIVAAIAAILWLSNTTVSGCEFMIYALLIVGAAILLIGIITGSVAMIVVGIILILVALFIAFAQQIVGAIYWAGAVCANIGLAVANFFIALWYSLVAIWHNICAFFVNLWNGVTGAVSAMWNNCIAGIVNVAMGLWNSIKAIASNIGIAFQNAWIWAKNTFWEFIADVLTGVSKLEPVINGVAKLLGKKGVDFGAAISNIRGKKEEYKSFVSVSDAWSNGMNTKSYQSVSDAWSKGWNTRSYDSIGDAWKSGISTYEYKDLSDAYTKGAAVGASIQDKVGAIGDKVKNTLSGLDMNKLTGGVMGKDLGALTADKAGIAANDSANKSKLPNASDPKYNVGNAYKNPSYDDLLDGVNSINDNTSDIADQMSDKDMEYLRKLAQKGWEQKYTNVEVKIDMTNNNTVNGETDLDGIVTKLRDVVFEELSSVADGVYAN